MTLILRTTRSGYPLPLSSARIRPLRLARFKVPWAEWRLRRRYRDDLKRLLSVAPHVIADIGLTLEQAQQEVEKPVWRE